MLVEGREELNSKKMSKIVRRLFFPQPFDETIGKQQNRASQRLPEVLVGRKVNLSPH